VVLESTVLASPRVVLQAAVVAWKNANSTLTNDLWPILIDNGLKWAGEGWGGFATPESAIYVTPKLSKAEAAESMAPLIQFGEQLQSDGVAGTQVVITEFPSWGAFFDLFVSQNVAVSIAIFNHLWVISRN
jgi:hypothetical protein